jgi:hypothetical protein
MLSAEITSSIGFFRLVFDEVFSLEPLTATPFAENLFVMHTLARARGNRRSVGEFARLRSQIEIRGLYICTTKATDFINTVMTHVIGEVHSAKRCDLNICANVLDALNQIMMQWV